MNLVVTQLSLKVDVYSFQSLRIFPQLVRGYNTVAESFNNNCVVGSYLISL